MPKSDRSTRPRDVKSGYYYRRPLTLAELLPAVGIGIGAGIFAYYVTRLLIQRTPLTVDNPRKRLTALERSADA
jgi:hypothetical protein